MAWIWRTGGFFCATKLTWPITSTSCTCTWVNISSSSTMWKVALDCSKNITPRIGMWCQVLFPWVDLHLSSGSIAKKLAHRDWLPATNLMEIEMHGMNHGFLHTQRSGLIPLRQKYARCILSVLKAWVGLDQAGSSRATYYCYARHIYRVDVMWR